MKTTVSRREYKKVVKLAEANYIRKAMKVLKGNKTLVAKKLGMDRATLYRKLDKFKNVV